MTRRTPQAGGFFLILPIVIGFGWGLASGRAMEGVVIGLVIGAIAAVSIWVMDRRRG